MVKNNASGEIMEAVENIQEEHNLAMDLLKHQKDVDKWKNKLIFWLVVALIVEPILFLGGFFLWLNQYDVSSEITYEATGVYTAVDQSGNVVAKDLTDEQFKMFMEWLNNGESQGNVDQKAN